MFDQIALDMDGVLVDWISDAMRVHGHVYEPATYPCGLYEVERHLGLDASAFWKAIDAAPDFWQQLQPLPWLDRLLEWSVNHAASVIVLSSPSYHPSSWSGKREWHLRHIAPRWPKVRLVLDQVKGERAKPGRLLIDDHVVNIEAWRRGGGEAWLFPQPWNHAWADPNRVGVLTIDRSGR